MGLFQFPSPVCRGGVGVGYERGAGVGLFQFPSPVCRGGVGVGLCYNKIMDKKYILARELRKKSTPQEQKMWSILRAKQFQGLHFVRQYPIGKYIVDFACRSKKKIIEIDGGQHNETKNREDDEIRTKYLEALGYKVIRFWNNEINDNIEGVYTKLIEFMQD